MSVVNSMRDFEYTEPLSLNKLSNEPVAIPVKNLTRVLVADDSPDVRQSLTTIMSLEDAIEVVGEVSSGSEAVKAARLLKPDIVIMDLEMPEPDGSDFDGIAACAEIKAQNLAKVVIILTIHIDLKSRQRATTAKCDYFLEKSTEPEEFLSLLNNFH